MHRHNLPTYIGIAILIAAAAIEAGTAIWRFIDVLF